MRVLRQHGIAATIAAEFDDTALMKAFGREGLGVFPAPAVLAREISRQFEVERLGAPDDLVEIQKVEPDLVILDRNPLENIRHSETVQMVMLNGRLYDSALNEIGTRQRTREPLWWER